MMKHYLLLVFAFSFLTTKAQKNATYKESVKKYVTYPFSDPDPIPSNKIYPYFRFDGFTDTGVEQDWKVVMLENDYISVQIMPEIGGKVWSATEKASNKPFFYNNDVVKFRDIAMRGPWVSGGIEANYGIIGHAPSTSSPVDYLVRTNADGSVSCFTSSLDLLTRTEWVLEIRLEKDKAYFTTRSFWFNSTGMEQPYYTWMNAGIPVGEGLKFLYPGNHYIGHDGDAHDWPVDGQSRDLSYYEQNNFGGSKSYHVLGAQSDYFGALWEREDFGMIHYAKREDKLGKKIFLWAQSEEGRIWEDLLTDNSGQYVEIQSGRLFNQNVLSSSFTPFKQIGFSPYTSDTWTEYWYPFKGIGGFSQANLAGAFHIQKSGDAMLIKFSPAQAIQDSLLVFNEKGDKIAASFIKANPLEAIEISLDLPKGEQASKLIVKGYSLDLKVNDVEEQLSRPVVLPKDFDKDAAYGLYLQGRDLAQFRDYQKAEGKLFGSLAKDSLFSPALIEYGKVKLFCMQYDSAFFYFKKALSIDTYDGAANYYYGMAASKLSNRKDALDGFEVASLTSDYRNAAYTALAREYLKSNDLIKAKEYAMAALGNNAANIDALQMLCLTARIEEDGKIFGEINTKIKELNPLSHFSRFEVYLQSPTDDNKRGFLDLIRNEMPAETFLELAIWYANLGREKESEYLLNLAPKNTEILYWLAFLNRTGHPDLAKKYLGEAAESTPDFVFPFRIETAAVLNWATKQDDAWQSDYLLALINDHRGNREHALTKLENHTEKIIFAPFYMLRARLADSQSLSAKLMDVDRGSKLDPSEWRYGLIKAALLSQLNKTEESIQVIEDYYSANKENYIVGLSLVRHLVIQGKYQQAEGVLARLNVLPFEGATDARRYYRETKLMLAYDAMEKGKYKDALMKVDEAEQWPNHLGVGKPYQELINANLENWMKAKIYQKLGKEALSKSFLDQVRDKDIDEASYLSLIKKISSKVDQRIF